MPDFAISAALKRVKEGRQASLREIGRLKEVGDEREVMFGVLFGKMVRPACLDRGGLPATGQSIRKHDRRAGPG
jgi:hypothetical protein